MGFDYGRGRRVKKLRVVLLIYAAVLFVSVSSLVTMGFRESIDAGTVFIDVITGLMTGGIVGLLTGIYEYVYQLNSQRDALCADCLVLCMYLYQFQLNYERAVNNGQGGIENIVSSMLGNLASNIIPYANDICIKVDAESYRSKTKQEAIYSLRTIARDLNAQINSASIECGLVISTRRLIDALKDKQRLVQNQSMDSEISAHKNELDRHVSFLNERIAKLGSPYCDRIVDALKVLLNKRNLDSFLADLDSTLKVVKEAPPIF